MKKRSVQPHVNFDFSQMEVPHHRSESDILSDLEQVCTSSGYAHALAYICWRENFFSYSDEVRTDDLYKMSADERLLRTEISLLTRLMATRPIDLAFPGPNAIQSQIDASERLLNELHNSMNIHFIHSLKESGADFRGAVTATRALSLREPIFYAGESAFHFQYRDFSALRYQSDGAWLQNRVGFSLVDVVNFYDAVVSLQQRKLEQIKEGATLENINDLSLLPAFTCDFDEISSVSGVSLEKVEAIVGAFSPALMPVGAQYREIGTWNELSSRPIIRSGDSSFILFQAYCLAESAYESPFYWMQADKEYRNRASDNRGRFTEEFAASRLRSLFGQNRVHQNVLIYNAGGETVGEIDVLLLYADRAVILQAKSKRLTEAARKGVLGALNADFEKAVQAAYDQGYQCGEYIISAGCKIVGADGSEIHINPNTVEVFIVCLVAEHFPGLAYYADEFIKLKSHNTIRKPYIIDVFMLDVVCELLDSPLYFFSFLNRRHEYADRIKSSSEMSVLGFHLSHNLWFDEKMNFVNLGEDFSASVDAAMLARRAGLPTPRTPSGILTRHRGTYFGNLIEEIGKHEVDHILDLGYLLLTISEKAAKEISDAIRHICTRAQADGLVHDFSMAFGKCGITIHSGYQGDAETLKRLHTHCELSKYRAKADAWFGVALSPFPIGRLRLAMGLKSEWRHDPEMDHAITQLSFGHPKTSLKKAIAAEGFKRKIGVNQPCPCGSGKKYKKCCKASGNL